MWSFCLRSLWDCLCFFLPAFLSFFAFFLCFLFFFAFLSSLHAFPAVPSDVAVVMRLPDDVAPAESVGSGKVGAVAAILWAVSACFGAEEVSKGGGVEVLRIFSGGVCKTGIPSTRTHGGLLPALLFVPCAFLVLLRAFSFASVSFAATVLAVSLLPACG